MAAAAAEEPRRDPATGADALLVSLLAQTYNPDADVEETLQVRMRRVSSLYTISGRQAGNWLTTVTIPFIADLCRQYRPTLRSTAQDPQQEEEAKEPGCR